MLLQKEIRFKLLLTLLVIVQVVPLLMNLF